MALKLVSDSSHAEQTLVVFRIGDESYGIPVEQVREVLLYPEVTRLPAAPGFVEGIIRLRGRVIPIVDLRKRFGLTAESTPDLRVLIVTLGAQVIGCVVDAVSQVRRLAAKSIRPLPAEVPTAGREFLMAVAPGVSNGNDLLLILDVEKIFNLEEKSALAAVPRP